MSKEAEKNTVEDLALRVKPTRGAPRLGPSWLSPKAAAAAVAVIALIVLAGLWLALRDRGSFARRKLDFPPLPQLNAEISAAQERLKADPQDIGTLVELGTLHFQKGKEYYADAINELEEARELGALDPRIFYCLGVMYQEVGLYQFALEDYRRFLRHYPEDKEIRMLAAKLLYKQGNFAEAVKEYERLKYHNPSDPLIEENLGLSLWGAKETDRAIASFTALRTMGAEQSLRAEFYLSQIAYEKGDYAGSLEHLERAQPGPESKGFGVAMDRVYTQFALTYQKLNRWADAKAAWDRVLTENPNDAKAKTAAKEAARRIPAVKKSAKKG